MPKLEAKQNTVAKPPVSGGRSNGVNKQEDAFDVENYIRQVFKADAEVALAVSFAESGRRCNAVGDGHITFESGGQLYGASYGVFQIRHLKGRPDPSVLLDCKSNIDYAYKIFKAQGFKPWSVCRKKVRCYE